MSEIWVFLSKGGIIMVPLFLTSVLGLAVVIERAFFLRRKRVLNPELLSVIQHVKKTSDVQEAIDRIDKRDGSFLNIVKVALQNRDRSKEDIREAMIDQGRQETRILERGLVILETVAGIAPLLGLLGTVMGMIKVFRVISEQGLGQTQSLSGGISEALITTVVGLSIAIPALVAYNYFNNKVEDLILDIEKYSARLLEKLKRSR